MIRCIYCSDMVMVRQRDNESIKLKYYCITCDNFLYNDEVFKDD